MKTLLYLAEWIGSKNKIGGSFGLFGWSGEAAERIFDTIKNVHVMNMVGTPLMLKTTSIAGGNKVAHDYGKELAAKVA